MSNIQLLNEDCMAVMARYPDKYFDLALVDPPYGLGDKLLIGGKGGHLKFSSQYQNNSWRDIKPDDTYFIELFRVSKNQIIWGGNYFNLPEYRCPVIWDKQQPVPNFSAIELAWTSFDKPAKIFRLRQAGFIGENKIHPTQKPVKLYSWLLFEFIESGMTVLDTHLGSGSSAIAAHNFGVEEFIGCEIDKDYYEAAVKRFELVTIQRSLFSA